MRVGSASSSRIEFVPGRLAGHDHPFRPAQRRLDRRPEEGPARLVVMLRFSEESRIVQSDRDRAAGPQRTGVERRVQHLRAHLLGEHRKAGLLPGEPGRPVRRRRPGRAPPSRRAAGAIALRRRCAGSPPPGPRHRGRPRAPSRPSTYRPTPPRSAGTLVASTSTRAWRSGHRASPPTENDIGITQSASLRR